MGSGFQQPGFAGVHNGGLISGVPQGKQRVPEAVSQFDDAAFERAFAQAQQDMLDGAPVEQQSLVEDQDAAAAWQLSTRNNILFIIAQ